MILAIRAANRGTHRASNRLARFLVSLGAAMMLFACQGSAQSNSPAPIFTPFHASLLAWDALNRPDDPTLIYQIVYHYWHLQQDPGFAQSNPNAPQPVYDEVVANLSPLKEWAASEVGKLGKTYRLQITGPRLVSLATVQNNNFSYLGRPITYVQEEGVQVSRSNAVCFTHAKMPYAPGTNYNRAKMLDAWSDLAFVPDYFSWFTSGMRSGRCHFGLGAARNPRELQYDSDLFHLKGGLTGVERIAAGKDASESMRTHLIEVEFTLDNVQPIGDATLPVIWHPQDKSRSVLFEATSTKVEYFELEEDYFDSNARTASTPSHFPIDGGYYDVPLTLKSEQPVASYTPGPIAIPDVETYDIVGLELGIPMRQARKIVEQKMKEHFHLTRSIPGEVLGDADLYVSRDLREWILLYHNAMDPEAGLLGVQRDLLVPIGSATDTVIRDNVVEKYGADIVGLSSRYQGGVWNAGQALWLGKPMLESERVRCGQVIQHNHNNGLNAGKWEGADLAALQQGVGQWFRLETIRPWHTFQNQRNGEECGPAVTAKVEQQAIGAETMHRLTVTLMDQGEYANSVKKSVEKNSTKIEIDL